MKPKTKLQKRVAELSYKLSCIDRKQVEWARENVVAHVAFTTKNRVLCSECGEFFENKGYKDESIQVCPECGRKLKIVISQRKNAYEEAYFCIVDRCEEFQVFRYFYIDRTGKPGARAHYYIDEVMQKWMGDDGSVTIMAKSRLMSSGYMFDGWAHSSDLAIRMPGKYYYSFGYNVSVANTYPVQKWKNEYKRFGVNRQIKEMDPFRLLRRVRLDSHAETLLKSKQYQLLAYSGVTETHWPSIKICIRNNYIVRDASMYVDYLQLLGLYGKDLRNAYYVCPKNLKKEHDLYVARRQRDRDRAERNRQAKELLRQRDAELAFMERIKALVDLVISDSNITIVPLKSLEEFKQEGDIMKHCVFACKYWDKPDSLILSARIEDKPIETIEVNLNTFKVVQSRGVCNSTTKYHDQIVQLVNKNINLIRQRIAS